MLSVRTVLAMPELRLTARAGAALLDRGISRIYATELPDPARFLSGGELVLTGLLWLRSDDDVPPFVAALADRDVAVLVACDADTGVLPPALVAECERRGVPLLEAAVDLSFADVIERVGQALAGGHPLVSAVARGAEPAELVAIGAAELGLPCWVLTPLGRVVAGPEIPPDRVATLVREWLRADGRPRHAAGCTLLPVLDAGGADITRWFLVVGGRVTAHDPTVAELTGLIGVRRHTDQDTRRVAGQVAGTVLRAVLSGAARPAEIAATALAAGVDVRRPLRVLAAGAPVGRAVAVLTELVAVLRSPGIVGVVDEQVYALLPTDGGVDVSAAADALRLLEPALAGGFVVGVSSVVTGELRGAVQEARYALELGERQPGRTRVVAGDEVAVHRLLLAGVPEELRVALRRRVLGPVFDHDAEHGGDLIRTLSVFLDCSGSWAKAAARLHVHVNTLRYRIGRIEQLAGADLSDFTQRIDVYLALHSGE